MDQQNSFNNNPEVTPEPTPNVVAQQPNPVENPSFAAPAQPYQAPQTFSQPQPAQPTQFEQPMPAQTMQPTMVPAMAVSYASKKPVAALVLGILSLIAWIIPIVGLPVTITGLVLGIKGLKSNKKGLAVAGIVLCSLGLVASIVNSAIGAYMGATSRL